MFYIKINEALTAVVPLPDSASGNTVTYAVIKISDGSTFASGTMTHVTGFLWKCSFTPDEADTYVLTVNNTTLDQQAEVVYKAIGSVSPSDTDLTTLANLKEYLRITTSDDDTLLAKIITRSSDWIQKYCGRNFIAQDYTEEIDGDGTNTIILKQYPINSIASAYDDTDRQYGAGTAITVSELVYYSDGSVVFPYNRFNNGRKNVRITYNAGYESIPEDLENACIKLCAAEYLLGQGAINVVEGVIVDKPKRLKEDAMETIDYYRRIDVGV